MIKFNKNSYIIFLITLFMFVGINNNHYAMEETETIPSASRNRALERINPAIDNLQKYLSDNPSAPQNIKDIINQALTKTNILLDQETITHDHTWQTYHKEISSLYNKAKTMNADPIVINNIKELKLASGVQRFLLAIIGIGTVFAGLLILASIFGILPKILESGSKKPKSGQEQKETETKQPAEITGEVISAISTALYMHLNVYQEEQKQILTWDKQFRRFSPWNMSGRLSINQKTDKFK